MPFSTSEQALYDHLRGSFPTWFWQKSSAAEEIWGAYVKLFDSARAAGDVWANMSQILQATGIWLDQHAIDRGTFRQSGEDDDTLRARLRDTD